MKKGYELIQALSYAKSPSGHEKEINSLIIEELENIAEIKQDCMKNLLIYPKNYDTQKPNIMVDCHADEVGFLIQSIQPNGTLTLSALGGWFVPNIMGNNLWIGNEKGDWFLGIVGSTPPHFLKEAERNAIPSLNSLFVDIGANSDKEVKEIFGIHLGCPVVPYSTFHYDKNTHSIFGKALDNRLGCALMIEILRTFSSENLPFNLIGSSSTQEEMGLRGAGITSRSINPIAALILEATPADDIYTGITQTALGKGPQIRFKDASTLVSPELIRFTRDLAIQNHISVQIAVRDTGGTNAGVIHNSGLLGVPTLPLSVPTRYIHSHTALCKLQDYTQTLELSVLWLKNIWIFLEQKNK